MTRTTETEACRNLPNDSSIKGADYARAVIDNMELNTKSKRARIRIARSVETVGRYDEAGKQLFREYLARLTA